ncbi:hypothetical protein ElyMa_000533100 [Elysia marginata]|uniref:Uncharacterized protein n=1 Tax=Elysia marginata TaxID=1093978 RepID=A0AAV4FYP7_9GAST|nr:hypothetical protein ElyMa_000533100 [Elysia marginata]
MQAAVNKLKQDIWKDEAVEKNEKQRVIPAPRYHRVQGRVRRPDARGTIGQRKVVLVDKTENQVKTGNEKPTDSKGKKSVKVESGDKKLKESDSGDKKLKESDSKGEERIDNLKILPLLEALEVESTGPPDVFRMQQTAVSKIRRSIFKLPVSSPYTQYYPPEGGESGGAPNQVQLDEASALPTTDNSTTESLTPQTNNNTSQPGVETKPAQRGTKARLSRVRAVPNTK